MENSYGPGHPWYYKLGGKPLKPSQIQPTKINWTYYLDDIASRQIKDQKKEIVRLQQEIKNIEPELHRCIEAYKSLANSKPTHESDCNDWSGSMALRRNHIVYYKSKLAGLKSQIEFISKKAGFQKELF